MKNFFGRSPFVFFGALGLLNLPGDVIKWQAQFGVLLSAFEWISNWIWWPWNWVTKQLFGLQLHHYTEMYLTLALVFGGALLRAVLANYTDDEDALPRYHWGNFLTAGILSIFWPVTALYGLYTYFKTRNDEEVGKSNSDFMAVFFESFVVALVILAINFAFVMGGG